MKSEKFRVEAIDAMRGIAILMVILVHTAQRVPGLTEGARFFVGYGQMGVQLFFVASAYTLCAAWERHSTETHRLASFFIRRYFRIAPLYYFAIIIYFGYNFFWGNNGQSEILSLAPYTLRNVTANIFFVHGFVPAANNTIVPGGWSIGTEMIFYFCFPFLFALTNIFKDKILGSIYMVFIALMFNILFQYLVKETTKYNISNNNFLYFNFINQLPVFLVGVFGYFFQRDYAIKYKESLAGFFLFTLLAMILWNSSLDLRFSMIPTLSAFSFFFLLEMLKFHSPVILQKIGKVSYSMYIFHFLFAWILVSKVMEKVHFEIRPDVVMALMFFLVCFLTYGLSVVLGRLIEEQGIEAGKSIILKIQDRGRVMAET